MEGHGHGSVNHHQTFLHEWGWGIQIHFCFLGFGSKVLAVSLAGRWLALMGRAFQGHAGTRTCSRGILETPHGVPSTACFSHVMNEDMDG
jgi:hypothetical protein